VLVVAGVIGLERQCAARRERTSRVEQERFVEQPVRPLLWLVAGVGVEEPDLVEFAVGEEAREVLGPSAQQGEVLR
jgi:hypothetical protein